MPTTRSWIGNSLPTIQTQTYTPGPQPPGTTITATINGKVATYTSVTGTNDDLIKGLIASWLAIQITAPEFGEITPSQVASSPVVPAPNATYLQMAGKTAGYPFTVAISLTTPPTVTVTRTTPGKAGVNELQQISITPNARSGSFTLSFGGNTTGAIPIPPIPCTSAVGAAGVLTGAYQWLTTFITSKGETEAGAPSISLTLAAQQGSLTAIPLGPTGVTKRNVYRTLAGGTVFYYVATIADNTTTTYTDNATDATIKLNPNPPPTNGCMEGELEALGSIGAGNVAVGLSSVAATLGMTMPTSVIKYDVQFIGTLAAASQALITGSVTLITILPTITIAETQKGYPPQNAIQAVGWKQVYGINAPTGSFTITFPGLGVTTAPIANNASAATVLAAIQAAVPAAYQNSFAVSFAQSAAPALYQSFLWSITYQGALANTSVPLATVDASKMTGAAGDTIGAFYSQTQPGSATGENEIVTATINNNPTGGTFTLTATLANGNTAVASAVAYNATAATLAAAFPANTASVSGGTGGPYTIEFVGEAGTQKVTVAAASSLTGAGNLAGAPPSSNTTGAGVPTGLTVYSNLPHDTGSFAATGTYYYKVAAIVGGVESALSSEVSAVVTVTTQVVILSWSPVANATGYNVYSSTSSGAENGAGNQLVNNYPATAITIHSNATIGNTFVGGGGSAPTNFSAAIAVGLATNGSYYWKVTALDSNGNETTGSNEVTVSNSAGNAVILSWNPSPGAAGYRVYRATASGGETSSPALVEQVYGRLATNQITDQAYPLLTGNVPASDATVLAAPVQSNASTSNSGGVLATATYYYEVTAINNNGETIASNEKSISATGPTASNTVNWATVANATGYKIYRGTSASGENVLAGIAYGQATATFVDTGSLAATLTVTELAAGAAAINEVQSIAISGATGGTLFLAFEGQQTVAIAYNDSAATVQTDLRAISTIGAGNCNVGGAAGGPFAVTFAGSLAGAPQPRLGSNPAALTGSTVTSQSLTTTVTCTGPNFWDNAANWSPNGVPVTGDTVVIQNTTVDILYNLNQSAVTLAALQVDMSFVNGWIGLPGWNGKYYEYRNQYLQIGVTGTILIGNGKGSGPTLLKFDFGTNAFTLLVNNCGTSLDPTLPAILVKGNRGSGSSEIDIYKGRLGIAMFSGETATVDIIRQGFVSNVNSDSYVHVGPGVTLTTWYKDGGDGALNCHATTVRHENGTLSIFDGLTTTSITTLNLIGGQVFDRATGVITTLTVGTGAIYDRTDDSRAKTITNTTMYGGCTFSDPHGTITFTNQYTLNNCGYLQIKLDLGTNITGQRVQL